MFNRSNFLIFICFCVALLFLDTFKVAAAPVTQRFGGSDRYDTSIQISQNNWKQSDYIVVVSGENFPDALCAAPLAKKYNAPILLTQKNSLGDTISQEVQRLKTKNAFIVGGTGVVSQNVEKQLNSLSINCTRIQGKDRYETSEEVAELIGTSNGVVVASGENFPDAVSVAPIAAAKQMPILLATCDNLSDSIKNFVTKSSINKYYIIGGTASISDSVINGLNNCKRLSGKDRYETNSAVINEFLDDENFSSIYLANGEGFADALSGSAVAAMKSSSVILVNESSINEPIVQSKANTITTVNILGGSAVIPDTLVKNFLSSITPLSDTVTSSGTISKSSTSGNTTSDSTIQGNATSDNTTSNSTTSGNTTSSSTKSNYTPPNNSISNSTTSSITGQTGDPIFTGTNASFVWIWELQDDVNNYGSIDNLISKLKSLGITNVCIKYHEGSDPVGGGINYRDTFLKYVKNFKAAGFEVGTWGYNYFNYIQDEANLINEAIDNSDYYIFDAENDVSGKVSQAEEICKLVREKHPNAILGYTTYPIASYHQDIPYSIFNKYCNFVSPQCYWGEMQWSVTDCINKMLSDYKNYNLDRPIYPSIQTYSTSLEDYKVYDKYNFINTGYWDFDEIDSNFYKEKGI